MSIIPKSRLREYKADLVQTLDESDFKKESITKAQKQARDTLKAGVMNS